MRNRGNLRRTGAAMKFLLVIRKKTVDIFEAYEELRLGEFNTHKEHRKGGRQKKVCANGLKNYEKANGL